MQTEAAQNSETLSPEQRHQVRLADLILKDAKGNDLFITSQITNNPDRSFWFVTEAEEVRYKVTVKVEPMDD